MSSSLRVHVWRLGVAVLFLGGVTAGIAFLRNTPSEAYPGMPRDQQAYWNWVGTIDQDPQAAVDQGLALLPDLAHLPALYTRLATACRTADAVDICRTAFASVQPIDGLATLYRDAALTQILEADSTTRAEAFLRLAAEPGLDPTLARMLVDQTRHDPAVSRLSELEALWSDQLAQDSSRLGAAFGLGYAAVLRNDWDTSEQLLRFVADRAPDDPQAYRELGRIYFFTSRPDDFEQALEAGIQAAHNRFDLEQELIMRGNLGLAMLEWRGDYERAGALFEEALAQSRLLSKRRTEGFNLYRLGSVRLNQHRYGEALALLDSAVVIFADEAPAQKAEVVAQRGMTLAKMYRFSEAESALEEAMAESERHENVAARLQALTYLVQLRYDMGQYAAARSTGLEVLELAARYRIPDFEILARIVLGDVERDGGNYEGARIHYREGQAIAERTQNHARARVLYERLGLVALLSQDTNAAHAYFERMTESVSQHASRRDQALAFMGMGYTYDQFGNYSEAIRLYDQALAALPDRAETKLRTQILRNKAGSLVELGRFDEVIALLQEARRMAIATRNVQNEYDIEGDLGAAFLRYGRYDQAVRHFLRAEDLERELQWSSVHWNVLHGKAVAYWRLGKAKEAERAFREAISVIEALRDNINSTEGRAFFVQDKVQVYENFSAFLESQGRSKEAFHFDERARSRSLVDLLYTTQQGRRLDLDNLADQAIELNRRVRAIEQGIEETVDTDGTAAAYRSNRAAYLRRERLVADSLYRRVEIDLYGENQLYTFNPLEADSVQALLKPGEAILVYNLRTLSSGPADEHASVAYVVLPDTVLIRPLPVENRELVEAVRFFRDQISNSNKGPGTGWEPAARRLYADLLGPVRSLLPESVRHLHIIPEGILHYLPFAALQDANGQFLVEEFSLSVVPSATILKLTRERNPRRWSYMLLLADPDGRLPGARKEVLTIAAGATNRRHVLVGKEATQEMFEEIAANYDVIHFATHGNFISRVPWLSHLELYGGALSVEEIGHMRLDAYLVTLSACETALSGGLASDVPNGDEWVGLNQAFLAAGTPTVMASLWSIDDRISSAFMTGFYDRLGPDGKAYALAEMQRRFIDDARTRHPFYWAAFTIIGDPL